jgi:hypothetical protein
MWPRFERRPATRPVPAGSHDHPGPQLAPEGRPTLPPAAADNPDAPCPHGHAGGDRLNADHALACPLCRKDDHLGRTP